MFSSVMLRDAVHCYQSDRCDKHIFIHGTCVSAEYHQKDKQNDTQQLIARSNGINYI
jgi:hypothetical protein